MPAVQKSVVKSHVVTTLCGGSINDPGATFWDVSTTITPTNNGISRENPDKGKKREMPQGFKPYTDYSCTGTTYSESMPGLIKDTTSFNCGANPDAHKTVEAYGGSLITGISLGAIPSSAFVWGGYDKNSLLTQAYADAKQQAFDLSTELGELPEALAMLAKTRQLLKRSVKETVDEVRRRYRSYLRKEQRKDIDGKLVTRSPYSVALETKAWIAYLLAEFPNVWLELRYGWRPLLSSMVDLSAHLRRLRIGPDGPVVCRGYANMTKEFSRPVSVTQTAYSTWMKQNVNIAAQHTSTLRAAVAIQVSPFDAHFAANPVSTMWEMIPASFVVDWLFDVSSYLASLQGSQRILRCTMCTSIDVRSRVAVVGTNPPGTALITPVAASMEHFVYERTVAKSFNPTVRIQFNVDALKGADLLSLILQHAR